MMLLEKKEGKLGYCNAAHLVRRATFYVTQERIKEFAEYTPEEAVEKLFDFDFLTKPEYVYPLSDEGEQIITFSKEQEAKDLVFEGTNKVRSWWLYSAAKAPGIEYKLTLWLHLLFVTGIETRRYWDSYDYLELLRFHTKGSLRKLAIRMTKNLRMLNYLDNSLNEVKKRNNNYAREFLELFTILKGEQQGEGDYTTYTENDVEEAGRVFTGFTAGYSYTLEERFWDSKQNEERKVFIDTETGIFQGYIDKRKHDTGDKKFKIGGEESIIRGGIDEESIQKELEDFVQIVFDRDETAQNYCRRLYRFFVGRNITEEIETHIIKPLASELKEQDYKIEPIVKKLLKSKHFYSNQIIGGLVKSPLDLQMHLLSLFKPDILNLNYIEVKDKGGDEAERLKEQVKTINYFFHKHVYTVAAISSFPIFSPVNVNGYSPYTDGPMYDKKWITTGTLQIRYQLADKVVKGYYNPEKGIDGEFSTDMLEFIRTNPGIFNTPSDYRQLLEDFYALLFVSRPEENKHKVYLDMFKDFDWKRKWEQFVLFSQQPEEQWTNQMKNIMIDLKRQVDRIVKMLLKSSEFQVM